MQLVVPSAAAAAVSIDAMKLIMNFQVSFLFMISVFFYIVQVPNLQILMVLDYCDISKRPILTHQPITYNPKPTTKKLSLRNFYTLFKLRK